MFKEKICDISSYPIDWIILALNPALTCVLVCSRCWRLISTRVHWWPSTALSSPQWRWPVKDTYRAATLTSKQTNKQTADCLTLLFVRYFPAQSGKFVSIMILVVVLLLDLPLFFELKTVSVKVENSTVSAIVEATELRFVIHYRNWVNWDLGDVGFHQFIYLSTWWRSSSSSTSYQSQCCFFSTLKSTKSSRKEWRPSRIWMKGRRETWSRLKFSASSSSSASSVTPSGLSSTCWRCSPAASCLTRTSRGLWTITV